MTTQISFNTLAADPQSWLRTADELVAAADVLLAGFASLPKRPTRSGRDLFAMLGCLKGGMLLSAFAVENAFKACRIAAEPNAVKDGELNLKVMGGGRSGHDLIELAGNCGFSLSKEERRLLERLCSFGMWDGRYPVPKAAGAWTGANDNALRELRSEDAAVRDELIARAKAEVSRLVGCAART